MCEPAACSADIANENCKNASYYCIQPNCGHADRIAPAALQIKVRGFAVQRVKVTQVFGCSVEFWIDVNSCQMFNETDICCLFYTDLDIRY